MIFQVQLGPCAVCQLPRLIRKRRESGCGTGAAKKDQFISICVRSQPEMRKGTRPEKVDGLPLVISPYPKVVQDGVRVATVEQDLFVHWVIDKPKMGATRRA